MYLFNLNCLILLYFGFRLFFNFNYSKNFIHLFLNFYYFKNFIKFCDNYMTIY
jgi:hypothetical protein